MTEKTKGGTARRPYQPPQLEQVELVIEEAVLKGGCKNPNSPTGPTGTGCRDAAPPAPKCSDFGT